MAFSFKKVFSSLQNKTVAASAAVGIDVGRSSIKVVELERSPEAPILKTYGEIQLGPYADVPLGMAVEADNDVLQKAIVDVLREAGVQATHGTMSLPLSTGFVTVVTLTMRENEELASRIPVEARKYIPLPLQEITLDWAPIGEPMTTDNGEQRQAVLLVALQNEAVLGYKTLLSNLELANQPMELSMFSAARAVSAYNSDAIAALDLGASVTKLYVYQRGTVAAIHRFSAGGVAVTEKFAELMSLDFAAAEELKRSATLSETQQADLRNVTHAVFDSALQEARRILQHYETTHQVTIEHVYLSGGVSSMAAAEQYVADTLQRPVEKVFPFSQVGYPAFMEDVLRSIGPIFTNSLGAALRQLQ